MSRTVQLNVRIKLKYFLDRKLVARSRWKKAFLDVCNLRGKTKNVLV